jgi:hypothetical protein
MSVKGWDINLTHEFGRAVYNFINIFVDTSS